MNLKIGGWDGSAVEEVVVVGRAEFAWNVKSGYTSESYSWFSCDVYNFGEVAAIQKFQRALYGAAMLDRPIQNSLTFWKYWNLWIAATWPKSLPTERSMSKLLIHSSFRWLVSLLLSLRNEFKDRRMRWECCRRSGSRRSGRVCLECKVWLHLWELFLVFMWRL